MQTITINKKIKAQQYVPGIGAPDGAVRANFELHWSADKKVVYFSFANLRPRYWMGVQKFVDEPASAHSKNIFEGSWCKFTKKNSFAAADAVDVYWREALSFSFFSVKSLASATQQWKPVWLDHSNDSEMEMAADYISMSGWVKTPDDSKQFETTLMVKAPANGHVWGFQPLYMKPTDWLVIDGEVHKIMSDTEFMQLQAVTH